MRLLILFLLLPCVGGAQTEWTVYNNGGDPIDIDKTGNIWTTIAGNALLRFDGDTSWTTYYGRCWNWTDLIAADNEENIWMHTWYAGDLSTACVNMFDGTNWVEFGNLGPGSFAAKEVSSIVVHGNNVWFGHYVYGLAKFDGTTWTYYNASNSLLAVNGICDFTIDKNGVLWIATCDSGLVKFDGMTSTNYNTSNSEIPTNKLGVITIDKNGNKWIGGGNKWIGDEGVGLIKFNNTSFTLYSATNSNLPENRITCIATDPYGNLWLGAAGPYNQGDKGLTKFDGANWLVFDTTNSPLTNNRILSIAVDDSANIWIATGDGLVRLNEEYVKKEEDTLQYQPFQLYPNPTTGLFTVAGATGEIQVHDLFGRLVLRTNESHVDMSSYPAGIYMVQAGEAVRKLILH